MAAAARGEPGAAGRGRTRGAAEERPRSAAPSAPRGSRPGGGAGRQQCAWSCSREPAQPAAHCGCLRAGSFCGSRPRRPPRLDGGWEPMSGRAARTRGAPGTAPAGPASPGGRGPGPARTPAGTGAPPAPRCSEACGRLQCGARGRLVPEQPVRRSRTPPGAGGSSAPRCAVWPGRDSGVSSGRRGDPAPSPQEGLRVLFRDPEPLAGG